jgi:two-component system phosphate regulon sensor histidine kinase PhoR
MRIRPLLLGFTGIFALVFATSAFARAPMSLWGVALVAALSAALLLMGLAALLQRRWVKPVREMSQAAARMAAGRWDTRVHLRGGHNVRKFCEALNVLAAGAERQLADLSARQDELHALVDSLPDPILLTDPQQRVALVNAPAARLLALAPSQVLGEKLINVLSDQPLLELFESASAATGAPDPRDVRLTRDGQRLTYQAVATRTAAGGVLMVMRDVTDLAATVQMKTDFVANASHELRTPIAAIKIAFETLREVYRDDAPQADRCVTIIAGHLRRLEEMLTDLLDLSRVESPDLEPHLSPIHAEELFTMVRTSMATAARQKGVELAFALSPGAVDQFDSDKRLLNLVLRNLVENSIKFTPPGGQVTVSLGGGADESSADGEVLLSVRDTGIGIPPEHQERVFERFYQVDAARSSTAGRGTGLGLAIVKHAIHALGGTVDLSSAPGRGTTVTCRLPRARAPTRTEIATSA